MVGGCNNESVSSVSESEKLKKVTCINYPELYRGIGKKMDVGSHVKKVLVSSGQLFVVIIMAGS